MLKIAAGLIAAVVLAPIAWADDAPSKNRGYIAGSFAKTYPGGDVNLETTIFGEIGSTEIADVEYGAGTQFGLALGATAPDNGLRLEIEFLYAKAKVDDIDDDAGFDVDVDEPEAYSAMVNLAYDFNHRGWLKPFVFAGIGVAWLDFGEVTAEDADFLEENDINIVLDVENEDVAGISFAYQGGLGLALGLGRHVDLYGAYRYFGTTGVKKEDGFFDARFGYYSHNLETGLRLIF